MLRNTPDPKYKAAASTMPIPTDKTSAVETDGSSLLSAVEATNSCQFSLPCLSFFTTIAR